MQVDFCWILKNIGSHRSTDFNFININHFVYWPLVKFERNQRCEHGGVWGHHCHFSPPLTGCVLFLCFSAGQCRTWRIPRSPHVIRETSTTAAPPATSPPPVIQDLVAVATGPSSLYMMGTIPQKHTFFFFFFSKSLKVKPPGLFGFCSCGNVKPNLNIKLKLCFVDSTDPKQKKHFLWDFTWGKQPSLSAQRISKWWAPTFENNYKASFSIS